MAKDRLSPLKENILPTRDLLPMGANRPANYLPNLSGSVTPVENDFMPPPAKGIELPKTVTTEQLYEARRFPVFNPEKTESDFAYGQSLRDKAVNGILKGANLAATTVAGGFATLYGAVKAPFSGRLADIWDNEGLRSLDKYNNEVDNYILPNYYTDAEKNSAWYSTDNWMTANFLFDKLIKNSGFAVGAMVGGNIANAGLLRAGSALGKLAGAGAMAAESSQAFKLFTPLLRNTARAFSAGKNIEAAAILEKEISSIADLAAKSSKLAELGKLQVNLANFNDTARRYAIAAYSSAGEASFEALQTANEYRNKLIEKYKSENYGAEPPKEVLDKINADSEKVGRTSFFGNLALLSITESVQLPYLLGSSYKNSKQVANSLVGKVDDVTLKGAKYVAAKVEPTTVFGKIYKGAVGASKYVFDPKEAGQEIGQYALQVGTQNYFKKANESEDANILTDGFLYGLIGKDEFGKEVGALISKEGIESGILGGITGGLMQARGAYAETKAVKNNTKAFLEELNSTPSFKEAFQDKLDSSNRGVVLQQQYEDAIKQGDKLEAQDLKADMMHNYLATRIKYGRFDMVMDDIQELRSANINDMGLASLKEQGLANINDTTESFQKRLNNLELVAKNTEQLYKAINLRYSGEILTDAEGAPVLSPDGRQLRKYSDEVIDKLVYASSKIADYDVRIPQVNTLLSQNLINTFDVLQRIIEEGKPNKTATQEALSQINKLDVTSDVKDVLKTQLSDVIELSLRRKLFIEEYDDIKKNPLNYTYDRGYGADEKIDTSPAIVKQKEKLEGEKKSKIVNAELTIGKEYSLKEPLRKEGAELQLAPKITVLSKTLGGEFEVKLPNGKIKFLTPNEFKNYSISDTENASPEFTSILNKAIDTVLNKEEYSKYKEELATGKPEDVLDRIQFINSLDDQNLINDVEKEFNNDAKSLLEKIEKEKVAQEGLLSQKEVLDRELGKLAPTAGSVESVPSTPGEVVGTESKAKDVDRLFLSTTSPSEDLATEETNNTPHIKRARYFLNNFKFFKNRNKIKVIIVTEANAKEVGLDGIIHFSWGKKLTDALPEIESDVNQKFMAQVFITQTPEGDFFVNEKGEKLSKVGEESPTILDNVVFQKMTSAELTTENGFTKVRAGQELEAKIALEAYRIFRNGQFEEKGYTPYPFAISRGIANQPKVNGVYEDNHMSDILGPNGEEIIAKHDGLLEVVIDGKIVHDGETLSFPIGTTLVKYGDLLDFANNKTLTAKQANNTFGVINALAKDLIAKSGTAKAGKPNFGYITFLKNVLFFKFKEDPTSPNQIRLDTTTMEFKIGDKSFPLSKIEERKQEMIEALQKAFISVNNKTLKDGTSKQFTEYVADKDGNLTQVIWPNYQSFLMSGKNPDGSSRSVGETPLITHTTKPTDNKNSYKQKYAYITNRDVLPYSEVSAKKTPTPAPTAPTQGATKMGPYEVNTTTPQTFPTTSGPVLFTATFKDGVFDVTVLGGEGIESISTDPIKLKAIDGALKRDQNAEYIAAIDGKLNEDKVKLYLKTIAIPATLKKESETQQAAPVAPQQAPVVSDIETEIKETLRNIKYANGTKIYDNPDIQYELEISQNSKNVANALSKNEPLTFEFLKNNLGAIFTTNNSNVIKVSTNKETGKIELSEVGTVRYIAIDKNNNISYDFENRGKQLKLEKARAISQAESKHQDKLKDIFKKYDVEQAPAPVVSDIEAKKADIERRRQEELKAETNGLRTARKGDKGIFWTQFKGNRQDNEKDQEVQVEAVSKYGVKFKGNKDFTNFQSYFYFKNTTREQQINTVYDAEYVTKVKKGEFTKYQAKDALIEIGRLTPELGKQIDDAELAALEEKPVEAPKPTTRKKRDSGEYRMVGKNDVERMTNSELEIFKQWHSETVPLIPFEDLNRMVIAHNGKEAWGVFEKGVAKFVRGGLRGTEYHEIGHGIWTMLSAAEQEALLNEFKSNSGTFTDRESGKSIEYAEATDKQAEERIWDDFSDFRLGKLPARSLGERVRRLFKMIMDFFKSFITKPSLKEELFKAIDSGKFKETKLSERAKTLAPKYKAIEGLTEEQTNGYIQDMVFQVKRIIFRDGQKELLFNPLAQTGEEVFSKVRQEYEELGEIEYLGEERYNELVKKSINFLRTLGISFNADEVVSINDENANSRDYAPETFSVDWKKNSTGALKFLLSTLSEREASNQSSKEPRTTLVVPPAKMSKLGADEGYKILNFNRVFATLLDRLHNTNDPAEFTKKFIELAKEDANYLSLFTALGGNLDTHTFDFDKFGVETDWRLFIQFFNTFSRQKPEALIQYVSEEGEVYTGPANIYTTISKTTQGWIDNMKTIGKSEGGLISFTKNNKGEKVYKVDTQRIAKADTKKGPAQIKFLNSLGIEFDQGTYNGLSNKEVIIKGEKTTELDQFVKAVIKIQTYLGKNNELMTFDAKRLDIGGPLRTLATLHTKINNPNQDSTYFGVEGQRIGAFSENNAPSYFENTFNESTTLDELLEKMPQLNDVYSRGSEVLKKGGLFFNAEGERIATLNVGYIQGTKNQLSGKDKSTAKLSRGERFVQGINQNINGNYYVLIPGDSSTEWMMNLGNVISMEDVMKGDHWNKVYNIYSNYLNDEINLALEDRTQNIYQRAKSQELRIMKDILPEKIVETIESMIKDGETYDAIQDYISKNREAINSSIKDFTEDMSKETIDILINTNQINMVGENEYYINAFDTEFLKKYNLSGKVTLDELMNFINFANINYQINNQEYHKILFGDPYQFKTEKGKLDETKRIKSFLSGRRRTFDMVEYNNKLKEEYNTVDGITLEEGTPGYHEYKEYTNTVTFANVDIVGSIATLPNIPKEIKDAFAKTDETDAMSWLMDNTHKEIALKEGQWPKEAEAFHQWHMAYTRQAFLKKNLFKTAELKEAYENSSLNKKDAALILKDIPKYKLAVRKPIISGNKNNKTELDIVLDKTSQMPIYYHMVEDTALGTMYEQMFNQNIGYAIVISGRKVGAEDLHSIYVDGKINTAKFENIVEVPWKIYGTQVETMSEGDKTQTRGSQPTKIVTSDLYDNGEPIGNTPERKEFIAKAVKRHDGALDMLNKNGYNELLNKLGVVDLGDTFALENKQAVSDTLMYEMMRRELSENAIDTIQLDENGEFIMPFEASPSYAQIKSILYSLVRKALTSPQMSGSPHVQVPVTMFEKATEGRSFARKIDGNWVKISKAQYKALTEEEKKSVMLTDDTLKFYTEDDPYCEILLPHWFKNKFSERKFKTDAQSTRDEKILKYLNTPEGRKILTGIGFRIPTQSLSSIEVFRVKGFLPEYMGSTVVVPSEITTKAGSDFDIDKLNMYLKSVYVDKNGNVRLVKYLGTEEATKEFYGKVFDDTINIKAINKSELFEALQIMSEELPDPKNLADKYNDLLGIMLEGVEDLKTFEDKLMSEIEKLGDENLQAQLRDKFVRDMYTKSLENEYYESIEELVTLPENFNKLISPVNDAGLEKMSEVLDDARGYNEANIKGRLINRNYMTNLRHAFITGKRWVGIAAVNITNLSLRQKAKVYLDPSKLLFLSGQERKFVKDLSIVLPHNKITVDGKTYVSLSGTRTADLKQLISERYSGYATAFVDIANKPFITKIIKSDTVVSTFMFLEAIGAGDAGIFFLNQPIIEKYLEYLDGIGSKSVMGKDNLSYIKNMFPTTEQAIRESSISVEGLLGNISLYASKKEFNDAVKNAEQQLILNEFIKYKILADQLFSYTQATNYDTTKFGSSDLYLKKELGTISASNFNLISNVNDVLKNTFIGKLSDLLGKSFDSFGAIMKTEDPKIRAYMIDTIKEYATRKYMTADDYLKMANLINNSFLDYIIQNNRTYYNLIKPSLVDSETAVVGKLEEAKQKYPSIQILQELVPALGNREDGAQSIELKANVKDAYSENLYTGMMRELRDIPELNSLYNDIVNVAILQGIGQTAISIRNIIPVEDYAAKIKPIIDNLQPNIALKSYSNGMFQRNNFNNEDVFTKFNPYAHKPTPNKNTGEYDEGSVRINTNTGEDELVYFLPSFGEMKGVTRTSRRLLILNDMFNYLQLSSDYIKIPKVITTKEGLKINVATGVEVTKADYAMMKKKGSQDLYDNYYYKKVYTDNIDQFGNRIPLRTPGINKKTGDSLNNYYYKLINVYGDGPRAVEYNTNFTPSVINNGSMRIKQETSDQEIVNFFAPQIQEEVVPLQEAPIQESLNMTEFNKLPSKSEVPTMTYAGIGSRQTPQEVLNQMTQVAKELTSKGYTLNTGVTFRGGEEGADAAFSKGTNKKNLFSPEKQGSRPKEQNIARELHPNPGALSPGALKLMARNTNQIFGDNLNTPVDFVLFYAQETSGIRPKGGTGQAVEMARRKGIPTINMADSNWREQLNDALQTSQPSTIIKPTIDLSREWSGDLKTRPVYTKEGVNTMRTEVAKSNEHFGNPFSEAGYGNTIKVDSIPDAVLAYKDWLLNGVTLVKTTNKVDLDTYLKPFETQRTWILDQINQGKLDGAKLLYAGKSAARGQGMHPTALAEVVEQLRINQPLPNVNAPEGLPGMDRQIIVNQFNITIKPDGKMFYDNGNEVTDQTTINKVNIRKELQDGTLRVAIYNNFKYFILSDNKILGSGATNLGKESISDPTLKGKILAKAVTYKKTC